VLVTVVACICSSAFAANSITIESKSVAPGATGVQIGVYFSNDIPISDFELPVEIREQTPGSYITNALSGTINPAGRLNNSPLGQAGVNWPAANVFNSLFDDLAEPDCSGPLSHTFHASVAMVNFESPDAILYTSSSQGDAGMGEDIDLDPGADLPGVPSYVISFDVTSVVGTFVIDTCCIHPTHHVRFINSATQTPVVPSVTAGIITVGNPDCPQTVDVCGRTDTCQATGNRRVPDCVINVLDITCMVDYIFRALQAPCPVSNVDLNCDCIHNVVDITLAVNTIFRGQTSPVPCGSSCP
jgi:hypothetical protein